MWQHHRLQNSSMNWHVFQKRNSLEAPLIQKNKKRASPGIEPGTSRTLSENYTTKPRNHLSYLSSKNTTKAITQKKCRTVT